MRKVLIISPEYVIDFGHVGKSLEIFAKFISNLGFHVEIVTPKSAPENVPLENLFKIHKLLPDIYKFLLLPNTDFNYPGRKVVNLITHYMPVRLQGKIRTRTQQLAWFQFYLRELYLKSDELGKLLGSLKSTDYIFFPSADNIVTRYFIKVWSRVEPEHRPFFIARFINVLENFPFPKPFARANFLDILRENSSGANSKLKIYAETVPLVDNFEREGIPTEIMYYPPNRVAKKKQSVEARNAITISALGSPRPDKGYEKLNTLIPALLTRKFSRRIRFLVQTPRTDWSYISELTTNNLARTKNVRLITGDVSNASMADHMSKSDILLLPYDVATYSLRGSAMLYEGCDLGIASVGPHATGFGYDITTYGLGATYLLEENIDSAVENVLSIKPLTLKKRIHLYNQIRSASLRDAFL